MTATPPTDADRALAREIEHAEIFRWPGCDRTNCLEDCDVSRGTCGRYVDMLARIIANHRAGGEPLR